MSYECCERCGGPGFVCATCSKPRSKKKSDRLYDPHRACRPHGLVPCPSHTQPGYRCDTCGVRVEYDWISRVGVRGFVTEPAGWRFVDIGPDHRGHSCPACSRDREVMQDAIGGLDMKAVGKRALNNLIAALGRIDWGALSQVERVALRIALDDARGVPRAAEDSARQLLLAAEKRGCKCGSYVEPSGCPWCRGQVGEGELVPHDPDCPAFSAPGVLR